MGCRLSDCVCSNVCAEVCRYDSCCCLENNSAKVAKSNERKSITLLSRSHKRGPMPKAHSSTIVNKKRISPKASDKGRSRVR